ncbi:Scr1 family TA system antitoxin-like transcriptional regulator [Streptomyces sp. NPDC060028]|uniref:Scr1 family TA system antitoxin-like transcriptional regulator n=1 Tax=Streptomyces sp. NPDC060028 TaxID=3347041 RepID=UPI0036A0AD5C
MDLWEVGTAEGPKTLVPAATVSELFASRLAASIPAGRLLLGAHLRRSRERRGIAQGQAARLIRKSTAMLSRYESGLVPIREADLRNLLMAYGHSTPRDLADAIQLLHHADNHEYHDAGAWELGRVEAVEALAKEITVLTCWAIPPILYSKSTAQRAVADGAIMVPLARPRPACPITLFVEEPVLERPHGGPAAMAEQLRHWTDLVASGDLTIQVFPITGLLPEGGGLLSEITLTGASGTIWVEDRLVPVFSTGPLADWRRNFIRRVGETALNPGQSLRMVQDAADRWAAVARAPGTEARPLTIAYPMATTLTATSVPPAMQADDATLTGPSISVSDEAPAEAQASPGPANDTAGTATSGPAARAPDTRHAAADPAPAPPPELRWQRGASRPAPSPARTPGPVPRTTAPPDRGTLPG